MLGNYDRAISDLEPTVETMARMGLDEEPMARIGLVRAYGDRGDRDRAHVESERAVSAADKIKDVQLQIGAGWERVRNAAAVDRAVRGRGSSDVPTGIEVAVEYAQQLESVRWDERERFVRETRDRLESERERRAARKISVEYLTDPLTGLANRRHLEGRLPEMVARAAANAEPVTLAFVDLDPQVSPETLVAAGARLRDAVATDGFVARWDGTEFVLVVPRRSAREVAAVVEDAVSETLAYDEHSGMSVGVAGWRPNVSVPGLVTAADEALLAARRSGGGIRLARPDAEPVPA
jgi:diguanylate cyclase (GGDEF)-like protein